VGSLQAVSQSQVGVDAQAILVTWCIWSAPHQILSPTQCPENERGNVLLQGECYVNNKRTVTICLSAGGWRERYIQEHFSSHSQS